MKAIFKGKTIPNGEATVEMDHWSADAIATHFMVLTTPYPPCKRFCVQIFDSLATIIIDMHVCCRIHLPNPPSEPNQKEPPP